jgi:hypothetical protein
MAITKQKKTPLSSSPSQQQGGEDSKSDEAEGGILLVKEDIQLIYKALRDYHPTEKEAHLHGVLVESFEELLATEYINIQLVKGEDCLSFSSLLSARYNVALESLRIAGKYFQAFPISGATSLVEPADTTTPASKDLGKLLDSIANS